MKAATPVDDELHRRRGDAWWDDDVGESSSIRPWINPVRCGHFARCSPGRGLPRAEGAGSSASAAAAGCSRRSGRGLGSR
jgi:hypothetical protein